MEHPMAWRRSGLLFLLIVAGGTLGTGIREIANHSVGVWHHIPLHTLAVNLVGAFFLGALAEVAGEHKLAALFFGTGLLGGLTTYSTFAVELHDLVAMSAALAATYAVATVVGGLAMAGAGMFTIRRVLAP